MVVGMGAADCFICFKKVFFTSQSVFHVIRILNKVMNMTSIFKQLSAFCFPLRLRKHFLPSKILRARGGPWVPAHQVYFLTQTDCRLTRIGEFDKDWRDLGAMSMSGIVV